MTTDHFFEFTFFADSTPFIKTYWNLHSGKSTTCHRYT